MSEGLTVRETDREMLIRIEGKIDLLNAENRRTAADVLDLRTRLNGHSDRIHTLETDKAQRTGMVAAARFVYGGIGAALAAGVAVLARHFGM